MQQDHAGSRRLGVDHFEDVVRAEYPGLLRYATALSGDPEQARDTVQEVLARAFVRWDRVGRADKPAAYLMRMVTNEYVSWLRRWHTRSVTAVGADPDRTDTLADHSQQIVERSDLDRRLARLPRRQQAALVLRFYQGLDYADAAAVLGCAEGTVRAAVSRGLAALRLDGTSTGPDTSAPDTPAPDTPAPDIRSARATTPGPDAPARPLTRLETR